eukprot:jgi/Botrbrau1/13146/Bobra.0187s0094.2
MESSRSGHDTSVQREDAFETVARGLLSSGQLELTSSHEYARLFNQIPDVFGGEDLLYCRVSTVVTWAPQVYIASIGNLINTVTHVGLLRCHQALLERVAVDGQIVEALDPARRLRGASVHSRMQACKRAGATSIASVPIFACCRAAQDQRGRPRVAGLLTLAWRSGSNSTLRHIPAMQAVARMMEPGFEEAMQEVMDEVMTHFLPYLASRPHPLVTGGPTVDEEFPPDDLDPQDKGDRDPTGPARTASVPPRNTFKSPAPASQGKMGEGGGDCERQFKSVSSDKAKPLMGEKEGWRRSEAFAAAIHPYSLMFKDASLELAFTRRRADANKWWDLLFDILFLVANILWHSPVMDGGPQPFMTTAVVVGHAAWIIFFTSSYTRHRSLACVLYAFLLPLTVSRVVLSFLDTPLATSALLKKLVWREIVVIPLTHFVVCVGHKFEFWIAAFIRFPLAFAICLYTSVLIALRAWGLPLWQTVGWMGVPSLMANAVALPLIRHWEVQERRGFFEATPLSAT